VKEIAMNIRKLCRLLAACGLGLAIGLGSAGPALAETGCNAGTWTEVPGGGITNGTAPAAAVLGDNLHLFVVGGSDLIFTNVYQSASGAWTGWSVVPDDGVAGGGGPAAVVYRGNLYLFIIDAIGHIFVNVLTPSGWGTWNEVPSGGVGTHGLAATTFQQLGRPDELNLFVRGTDGHIYVNSLTGSTWSGWSEVPGGGLTTHGPAATNSGNVFLYVRGVGGGIYENSRDLVSGSWGSWAEVPGGGYTTAAPGVATGHPTGIVLAVRGLGAGIYQNLLGPGGSGFWSELPGAGSAAATAGPAVVVYQGAFRFFVTGPGDRIVCSAR
jgi:hypothetical protein